MPRIRIESDTDAIDLNEISRNRRGVEVLSGVTGLGFPPVQVNWYEGAGDGAEFSSQRYLARDIDLPLHIYVNNRAELQALQSRLAKMMSGEMTLRFVEDDGSDWSLQVRRVGGGGWAYGVDTRGENELSTVVTLRAGDPFFTYSVEQERILATTNPDRGLIKGTSLSRLQLSGAQVSGLVNFENIGDVPSYPVWTIEGPGSNFEATSPGGESFAWNGTLGAGETLIIDTKAATVEDGTGANRYSEMGPAPRFWAIPPGLSTATTSMADTTSASRVIVRWRPRRGSIV